MHRIGTFEDPTLASRYECKYQISPMVVSALREFIQPFMRPDPFAALREGNRYPICSLYLDSEDLVLYHQTVGGHKNRFKLRVRSYSDDPRQPVFFEVKKKINNIVKKRRARLDREQAALFLDDYNVSRLKGITPDLRADCDLFAHLAALIACKPVIKVRYMREAYESRGGDPVRLTLDTDVVHAVTFEREVRHGHGRWMTTPVDGVILEIKFTERFPTWIADLVRAFGLRQQPVPKYTLSVDQTLLSGRESGMTVAGFTLPPLRI